MPVRFHDGVAWMILGYDAVTAVFADENQLPAANFYERVTLPWWGRAVPTMRGEEHRIHRAFMLTPLLPTRMRECSENVIAPLVHGLITGFGDNREVDFVDAYAKKFPFQVITRMLGLPDEDNALIRKLVSELFQFVWNPDMASRARDAMTDYLRPIVRARRESPGKDLISYFATSEVDGRLLDEADLIDLIRFLYPAAGENTTNALGLLLYWILKDQATYERVLRNPLDRKAAVEEVLRIAAPVSIIARYTEEPVTLFDTQIPAHSFILLSIGSANRDPAYFDKPNAFSLDRPAGHGHVTFGRGPHFCVGAHLARAELRATLDVMLDRLTGLRLSDPDGVAFHGAMMRGPANLPLSFTDVREGASKD